MVLSGLAALQHPQNVSLGVHQRNAEHFIPSSPPATPAKDGDREIISKVLALSAWDLSPGGVPSQKAGKGRLAPKTQVSPHRVVRFRGKNNKIL